MIKKTLYFGNPAYLSLSDGQIVIRIPEVENADVPDLMKKETTVTRPIEDIGVVVIDNRRITLTSGLMDALLQNNVAVIMCDERRMPSGLFLPLEGHTLQSERFRSQLEASLPLRKQLWQQTVSAKIANQHANMAYARPDLQEKDFRCLKVWAGEVKSGDSDNLEGRAAAFYWKNLFASLPDFVRSREGKCRMRYSTTAMPSCGRLSPVRLSAVGCCLPLAFTTTTATMPIVLPTMSWSLTAPMWTVWWWICCPNWVRLPN